MLLTKFTKDNNIALIFFVSNFRRNIYINKYLSKIIYYIEDYYLILTLF